MLNKTLKGFKHLYRIKVLTYSLYYTIHLIMQFFIETKRICIKQKPVACTFLIQYSLRHKQPCAKQFDYLIIHRCSLYVRMNDRIVVFVSIRDKSNRKNRTLICRRGTLVSLDMVCAGLWGFVGMQAFLLGIQSFCSKLNTCVHDGIDLVYSILCTIYCNTRPECQFFFFCGGCTA